MAELKPGYKVAEIGIIPEEWTEKKLSDISTVVRGGSPRPAGDPRYFNGDFIPWLTVAALTNIPDFQMYVWESIGFLTEEGSKYSRTLRADTLIIANSGATLGVAKILKITCCANDGIAALLDLNEVDKRFICYYINSQTKRLREVVATGNGQPNLNTGLIGNILVPLPPLAEQRAIADAISEADDQIVTLDNLIAKKRDIKQGAMQRLLTGEERLPGFSSVWEVKRLGEIAEIDPENLSASTSPDYRFSYISLEDVDYGILRSYSEQMFQNAPSRARRIIKQNDILLSTVRPNLKSHLLIREAVKDTICSTGFSVVRCYPNQAQAEYVFFHLFAHVVNRQIETLLTGSNYPAINSKDVRNLEIPFPHPDEQQAIAAVISDMDVEITTLEEQREKTVALKQGMMQELLTGKTRLV